MEKINNREEKVDKCDGLKLYIVIYFYDDYDDYEDYEVATSFEQTY